MTFNLVRIGWPNTAAIVALALIPIASLAAAIKDGAAPGQVRPLVTVTCCLPESTAIVTTAMTRMFTELN